MRQHEYFMKTAIHLANLAGRRGEVPIGSIIVIECGDLAEARAIADADPYHQAGLFRHVDVHPFKQVIPEKNS